MTKPKTSNIRAPNRQDTTKLKLLASDPTAFQVNFATGSLRNGPMQLISLRRPLQAAAVNSCRPQATASPASLSDRFASLRLDVGHSSTGISGRRWATVKSQGAYKLKNKKTIPKKLGAKRTGGMSGH